MPLFIWQPGISFIAVLASDDATKTLQQSTVAKNTLKIKPDARISDKHCFIIL